MNGNLYMFKARSRAPILRPFARKWVLLFAIAVLMPERGVQVQGQGSCANAASKSGIWVFCGGKDLAAVPVFGNPDATIVNLFGNAIKVLADGCFDTLEKMTTLNLEGNQIEVLPRNIFANNANLVELNLYGNQIKVLPHDMLVNNFMLEILRLDGNQVEVLPPTIFANNVNLEYLYLHGNQIKVLPRNIFFNNANLRTLKLFDNAIVQFETGTFASLAKLQRLILTHDGNGNVLTCGPLLTAPQRTPNHTECMCDSTHASFVQGMAVQFNNPVISCVVPPNCTVGANGQACANGGATTGTIGNCGCSCADGWDGANCQAAKQCTAGANGQACANGGNATGITGTCGCSCAAGWNGANCQSGTTTTDAAGVGPSANQDTPPAANGGMFAGIAVGGIVLVAAVAFALWKWRCSMRCSERSATTAAADPRADTAGVRPADAKYSNPAYAPNHADAEVGRAYATPSRMQALMYDSGAVAGAADHHHHHHHQQQQQNGVYAQSSSEQADMYDRGLVPGGDDHRLRDQNVSSNA